MERERGGVEDLGDALLRFCSVVLSGPLDGLYEGLLVIVVDEWRELCATDTQERSWEGSGEVQRERGGDVQRASASEVEKRREAHEKERERSSRR